MSTVEAIFRAVFDGSWRMAVLIVVFLALRALLRRYVSARILFWVWIAVAIRLVLPWAAPVKWSPFNLAYLTARESPTLVPQGAFGAPAVAGIKRVEPSATKQGTMPERPF